MKNQIKLIVSLVLIGIFFTGCEQSNIEDDPLKESLSKIQNYFIEANSNSDGELFKLLEDNPNSTAEDLNDIGRLNLSNVLKEIEVIKKEVNDREEEDIWNVAKSVTKAEFISNGIDGQAARICIFCCRGCLNDVKKDHCITIALWDMGPGC